MAEDEEPQDAATEAFEQLRGEVAQLRGATEGLAERLGPGPDYTPTLAAMAKTLERMEAHPALRRSAEEHSAALASAIEGTRRRFEAEAQSALTVIGYAAADIKRFAGELRSRQAQRRTVIYSLAGGAAAGALFWALASGPIARALPGRWLVPERMAAATLNTTLWPAGERLMRAADPAGWAGVAAASRLAHDNAAALQVCAKAAARAGHAQPCKVLVEDPTSGSGGR